MAPGLGWLVGAAVRARLARPMPQANAVGSRKQLYQSGYSSKLCNSAVLTITPQAPAGVRVVDWVATPGIARLPGSAAPGRWWWGGQTHRPLRDQIVGVVKEGTGRVGKVKVQARLNSP